nr:hypothetical protein [Vibrio breoganii]
MYNLNIVLILLVSLYLSCQTASDIFYSILICTFIGLFFIIVPIWGGGDSKLIISLAPLFSPPQLLDFFVATLLCGGFLSIFYWLKYHFLFRGKVDRGLPYGVAILCGANISLYFSQGLEIYS